MTVAAKQLRRGSLLERRLLSQFGAYASILLGAIALEPLMRFGEGLRVALEDEDFVRWLVEYSLACALARDLAQLQARWERLR